MNTSLSDKSTQTRSRHTNAPRNQTAGWIAILLLASLHGAFTQTGILDTGFSAGLGPSGWVQKMDVSLDGKIVIVGAFFSYDGALRDRIAQLNSDGSLDTAFNPGETLAGMLVAHAVVYQPDGKILFAGLFFREGNISNRVIRFTPQGEVDPDFAGLSVEGAYFASLAVQDDGSILLGGAFTLGSSPSYSNLARLTAAGTLDQTFDSSLNPDATVNSVALAADGSIWIGGEFQMVQGQPRSHLARITAAGQLAGTPQADGWNGPVSLVRASLQSVIVGAPDQLRVYEAGGAIVTPFANVSISGAITDAAVQSSGKVVLVGYLSAPAQNLVRFHQNGTVDESYGSEGRPLPGVDAARALPGDKLMIAGDFLVVGSQPVQRVARLFGDVTVTAAPWIRSEPPDINVFTGDPFRLSVSALGYPLFYQWFKDGEALENAAAPVFPLFGPASASFQDGGHYHVVISNSLGMITSRTAVVDVAGYPVEINQHPDGKTVIETLPVTLSVAVSGSDPIYYQWLHNGIPIEGGTQNPLTLTDTQPNQSGGYTVVVTNPWHSETSQVAVVNITVAPTNPGALHVKRSAPVSPHSIRISSVMLTEDGGILLRGLRERLFGVFVPYTAKLLLDGTPDSNFNPALGSADSTDGIVSVLDNGRLLTSDLSLLSPRGYKINSFHVPGGVAGNVTQAVLQSNGKIVVAGWFQAIGGLARTNIARLNIDGSADPTFSAPYSPNTWASSLRVLPDDRLYLAEASSGTTPLRLVSRFNANGVRDTTFNPTAEGFPPPYASALIPLADGRLLVGGSFSKVNGQNRQHLVMLNNNGSVDTSFNIGTGPNLEVDTIWPLPDGRFLAGGRFTTVNGLSRPMIVRFNISGQIDPQFYLPTAQPDVLGSIISIAPLANGDLAIAGSYQIVNGFPQTGLAVLHGDQTTIPTVSPLLLPLAFSPGGRPQLLLGGVPGKRYRLQYSHLIPEWFNLHDYTAGVVPQMFEDAAASSNGSRYYRVLKGPW